MVYVDAAYGNDSTGQRENRDKPFATLAAAMTHAQAGDTIIVWPGDYSASALNKADLTWQLTSGATITCSSDNLFNGSDIRIRGEGKLIANTQSSLIVFSSGQNIIECDSISGTSGAELINISGVDTICNIFITNDINTTNRPGLALVNGQCNLHITNIITTGDNNPALKIAGGRLDATLQNISCQNSSCISTIGLGAVSNIIVRTLSNNGNSPTVDCLDGFLCLDFCQIACNNSKACLSLTDLASVELRGGTMNGTVTKPFGAIIFAASNGRLDGYIEKIFSDGLAIFASINSNLTVNHIVGQVIYEAGNHFSNFGRVISNSSGSAIGVHAESVVNIIANSIVASGIGLFVSGEAKVKVNAIRSTFVAVQIRGLGVLCLEATSINALIGDTVIDYDSSNGRSEICACELCGGLVQCVKKSGSGWLGITANTVFTGGDAFVTDGSGEFSAQITRVNASKSIVRSLGNGSNIVFIKNARCSGPAIRISSGPASHIYGGRYISFSESGVILIESVPTSTKDIRLKNINLVSGDEAGPSINNATGQGILVKNYGTIVANTQVGGVPPPTLLFPSNIMVDSRVT